MPINVFGNSNSNNSGNKIHTNWLVQKLYLRTIYKNYIESNFEDDIDLKSQYRNKNIPDPISIRKAASKNYVNNNFNDPSKIKNTDLVDFNDENLDNVRLVKVNNFPAIPEHSTAKVYVYQAISDGLDEKSLLRLDLSEKLRLDEQHSIVLNSSWTLPKTIIELPTKSYFDSLHQDNEKSLRDLGLDFFDESNDLVKNNQDKDFNDKKLTNIDSIPINRKPTSNNEISNKKYIEVELDKKLF